MLGKKAGWSWLGVYQARAETRWPMPSMSEATTLSSKFPDPRDDADTAGTVWLEGLRALQCTGDPFEQFLGGLDAWRSCLGISGVLRVFDHLVQALHFSVEAIGDVGSILELGQQVSGTESARRASIPLRLGGGCFHKFPGRGMSACFMSHAGSRRKTTG